MRFRPCIDIHDGRVKQIVGGSLRDPEGTDSKETDPEGTEGRAGSDHLAADCGTVPDASSCLKENFVSDKDAAYYAKLYKDKGLDGGHVIMLNRRDSEYYEATRSQALLALSAYPGGLMAGGGIDPDNAAAFLDAGASHVIVTSYVFRNGQVDRNALKRMCDTVGRQRLCLDLSCRRRYLPGQQEGGYYIVTDRWQKFTDVRLDREILELLSGYACEYLVHAVDIEGRQQGIDEEMASVLKDSPVPVTYAGGVGSLEDIKRLRVLGEDRIDVTVGSALDIFGGSLDLEGVLECIS